MTEENQNANKLIFEPNFTVIPNIIFDYWMPILSPADFKVLLCICRKTFGWQKIQDKISLKQIEKLTGLSRQGIVKSIKNLVLSNLVLKTIFVTKEGENLCNLYSIDVNCIGGGSKLSVHLKTKASRGGVVNSVAYGVVNSVDTQKKDTYLNKDTTIDNAREEESSKDAVACSLKNSPKENPQAVKEKNNSAALKQSFDQKTTSKAAASSLPAEKTTTTTALVEEPKAHQPVASREAPILAKESKAKTAAALFEKVDKSLDAYSLSQAKQAIEIALESYEEGVVAMSIDDMNAMKSGFIRSWKALFPTICSASKLKGPRKAADAMQLQKRISIAKCLSLCISNAGNYVFDEKKLYVNSGATTKEYTFTGNDYFWSEKEKFCIEEARRKRNKAV